MLYLLVIYILIILGLHNALNESFNAAIILIVFSFFIFINMLLIPKELDESKALVNAVLADKKIFFRG